MAARGPAASVSRGAPWDGGGASASGGGASWRLAGESTRLSYEHRRPESGRPRRAPLSHLGANPAGNKWPLEEEVKCREDCA